MRGKVYLPAYVFIIWGITPAYAGKRTWDFNERLFRRDHPRVCGEKNACWGVPQTPLGSPPRMRGKGLLQVFIPEPLRITPACAGKRRTGPAVRDRSWDHPRVCGEKPTSYCLPRHIMGSPPRMRGKEHVRLRQQHSPRITPAYAGKSRPPPENAAGTFCAPHPDASGGCSPVPPDG